MKLKRIASFFVALVILFSTSNALAVKAAAFDKANYANADPWKYHIEVDLVNNIVTIFTKDAKSKYTVVAKQFPCSVGAPSTPTPTGSYKLNDNRRRFGYFSEYKVYGQYWIHVVNGIYFHSLLYTQPKEGYMTKSSYNNLGKGVSHGCIRMLVEDIRWMYYNLPSGTTVNFTKLKPKDTKKTAALLPKMSFSKYKPTADIYEKTKRPQPSAKVMKPAQFIGLDKSKQRVEKGEKLTIVSSGRITCRVIYKGKTGHIATSVLEFIYNGPKAEDFQPPKKQSAVITELVGEKEIVITPRPTEVPTPKATPKTTPKPKQTTKPTQTPLETPEEIVEEGPDEEGEEEYYPPPLYTYTPRLSGDSF